MCTVLFFFLNAILYMLTRFFLKTFLSSQQLLSCVPATGYFSPTFFPEGGLLNRTYPLYVWLICKRPSFTCLKCLSLNVKCIRQLPMEGHGLPHAKLFDIGQTFLSDHFLESCFIGICFSDEWLGYGWDCLHFLYPINCLVIFLYSFLQFAHYSLFYMVLQRVIRGENL